MKSRLELPREIRSLAVPLSRGARAALPALALAALLIAVSQFTASGSGRLSAGLGGGCTASVPDLVTDTGQSQSDNLTNDNTPAFQGTYSGLCNAITLYEGTTALGSDTSLAGGTWMINNSAQLGEGGHSVRARGSGRSSYPATLDVVIDTVAPVASVPDLAPASDTGTSNTDNTTHDTTPTFRGTAPGASRVFVRALVISSAGQSTGTLVVVGLRGGNGQQPSARSPLAASGSSRGRRTSLAIAVCTAPRGNSRSSSTRLRSAMVWQPPLLEHPPRSRSSAPPATT